MTASLYILTHIVDDFGNHIPVIELSYESYCNRYHFFKDAKWTTA